MGSFSPHPFSYLSDAGNVAPNRLRVKLASCINWILLLVLSYFILMFLEVQDRASVWGYVGSSLLHPTSCPPLLFYHSIVLSFLSYFTILPEVNSTATIRLKSPFTIWVISLSHFSGSNVKPGPSYSFSISPKHPQKNKVQNTPPLQSLWPWTPSTFCLCGVSFYDEQFLQPFLSWRTFLNRT